MKPSDRQAGAARSAGPIVVVAFIALCAVVVLSRTRSRTRGETETSRTESPAARGDAVEISFHSSTAKKSWVDEMVKAFERSGATAGGRPVRVKVTHVNSGDSLEQLKEGKVQPDLWSPGDESWMQLAAEHWKRARGKPLFASYRHLVDVPLVLAVWEPMARAMGWPGPVRWKDVAKLAADPRGWAAVGHPEWGAFRWGHAHPDANSGFLTVLSLAYAATGKTDDLTLEDLARPSVKAFIHDLEQRVEHYGLSNVWLDDVMHAKGPAYLSAAAQYENTIIETNEKHGNKPGRLVAVYPADGAFWTTHPIAVVEESWTTPEKAEAAGKLADFLLSADAQRRAMELGLRPVSKDVTLGPPFDAEHGVDPKAAATRRFSVPDEKILRRVIDLWEEAKNPATVLLVLDRSGSMKGAPIDAAKEGAVQFVRSMKPRDEIEIRVFNQKSDTLVERCAVKSCAEDAVARLQGIFAEGGTALHDVVAEGFRELVARRKKEPGRRYGLIVLSDGRDTSSAMSRNDFLDALPNGEDPDVPKIFTIAYGPEADRELLREVAGRTNARLFESKAEEIAKTYKELSANF